MNDKDESEIWKRELFGLNKESSLEKFYTAFQDAEKAANNKDISKAKKLYLEAREIYIGLSNEQKHSAYHKLSALYEQLALLIKEESRALDSSKNKYGLPKLVKYSIPVVLILLILTSLFLLKPSSTGYVVLGKEAAYNKTLNLKVNESGNYTLNLKNPGIIKSIQASGNVIGNGTVKIYIEKDGKRYLIFDNKKQ